MPPYCEVNTNGLRLCGATDGSAATAGVHLRLATRDSPGGQRHVELVYQGADTKYVPAYISAKVFNNPDPAAIPAADDIASVQLVTDRIAAASTSAGTALQTHVNGAHTTLAARVGTAESSHTALAARVGTAEGNHTALAGRVATAESNHTALAGRVDAAETAHTAFIAGLTNVQSAANASKRLLTVNGKIKADEIEVTTSTVTYEQVTNSAIADKYIVLASGSTEATDDSGAMAAAVLFDKGNNRYAGLVRQAPATAANSIGTFHVVDEVAGVAGADPLAGPTGVNQGTMLYAKLVADRYGTSSDARLKENVVPIGGALERVGAMRGVFYDWIDKQRSGARQIGVIAQEVHAACPELVDATGAYMTVDYARLSAVLIESVKELAARNEALERRLASLERASVAQ